MAERPRKRRKLDTELSTNANTARHRKRFDNLDAENKERDRDKTANNTFKSRVWTKTFKPAAQPLVDAAAPHEREQLTKDLRIQSNNAALTKLFKENKLWQQKSYIRGYGSDLTFSGLQDVLLPQQRTFDIPNLPQLNVKPAATIVVAQQHVPATGFTDDGLEYGRRLLGDDKDVSAGWLEIPMDSDETEAQGVINETKDDIKAMMWYVQRKHWRLRFNALVKRWGKLNRGFGVFITSMPQHVFLRCIQWMLVGSGLNIKAIDWCVDVDIYDQHRRILLKWAALISPRRLRFEPITGLPIPPFWKLWDTEEVALLGLIINAQLGGRLQKCPLRLASKNRILLLPAPYTCYKPAKTMGTRYGVGKFSSADAAWIMKMIQARDDSTPEDISVFDELTDVSMRY